MASLAAAVLVVAGAAVVVAMTGGGGGCSAADCESEVSGGHQPITLTEPAVATPPPTAAAPASTPTAQPAPLAPTSAPPPAQAHSAPPADTGAPPPAPAAAGPPPAAPPPSDGGACGTACGEPRHFCDTWAGGMCNDYRTLGDNAAEVAFSGEPATVDCVSTTNPHYVPGGVQPCAFSKHEHFMTRLVDGDFGLAMMRFWQPMDLSSERHIHADLDLKISTRRYVRFMITPQLVKRSHDDRGGNLYPGQAIDIWLKAGGPEGFVSRSPSGDFFSNSEFCDLEDFPDELKVDDVRRDVDLYVSRGGFRVFVDGVNYGSCSFPPVSFDRAYLYIEQASYNPCKDGECSDNLQTFHWDNTAFDGPSLGYNSLTPAGEQDVVFNAYSQSSCTVKGYAAQNQGDFRSYNWNTFVARMPVQAVSAADVQCTGGEGGDLWDGVPHGFEVVHQ